MSTWDEYPELWAEFEKARKALKPLEAKRAKEMAKVNAVQEKVQVLFDKKDALHVKACADWNEIAELRAEVARLAKAMGAQSA